MLFCAAGLPLVVCPPPLDGVSRIDERTDYLPSLRRCDRMVAMQLVDADFRLKRAIRVLQATCPHGHVPAFAGNEDTRRFPVVVRVFGVQVFPVIDKAGAESPRV